MLFAIRQAVELVRRFAPLRTLTSSHVRKRMVPRLKNWRRA